MRKIVAGLSLAFLAGAALAPAQAGPLPDGGVTAAEVAAVMRAMKLPVEQTTDRQGDPLIISNISGRQCEGGRCGSIQFSAGFNDAASVPMVKVMDWNRTKRFGRAYLDSGSVYVEMDMDVERGATTEALANNFDRWAAVVEQFPKYFQ